MPWLTDAAPVVYPDPEVWSLWWFAPAVVAFGLVVGYLVARRL